MAWSSSQDCNTRFVRAQAELKPPRMLVSSRLPLVSAALMVGANRRCSCAKSHRRRCTFGSEVGLLLCQFGLTSRRRRRGQRLRRAGFALGSGLLAWERHRPDWVSRLILRHRTALRGGRSGCRRWYPAGCGAAHRLARIRSCRIWLWRWPCNWPWRRRPWTRTFRLRPCSRRRAFPVLRRFLLRLLSCPFWRRSAL